MGNMVVLLINVFDCRFLSLFHDKCNYGNFFEYSNKVQLQL